jgi:hypothetical protein
MTRAMLAERQIWWLNPWKLVVFVIIPAYTFGYVAPQLLGPEVVVVRFRIFFGATYFWLGLAFLATLALWAFFAEKLEVGYPSGPVKEPVVVKDGYMDFLALVTIGAYGLWFHGFVMHPEDLLNVLRGSSGAVYDLRLNYQTISGVTTASQFGIAYAALYAHRVWIARVPFHHIRFKFYILAITGLAAFRAYGWAERLALIEELLPLVTVYLLYRARLDRNWKRTLVFFAPLFGVLLLLAYFATSEYFRSWLTHYRSQHIGFAEFVVSRVLTYYYTALNNGAMLLANREWPSWDFGYVLQWLHRFPLLVGPIFRSITGYRGAGYLLRDYGDPEFNNMSGIFTVFYDVGIGGALVFAAVWGVFLGWTYVGLVKGRGVGAILYPVCYVSLLEVMRILYLCESRALPFLVAIVVGYAFFMQPVYGAKDVAAKLGWMRIRRRRWLAWR